MFVLVAMDSQTMHEHGERTECLCAVLMTPPMSDSLFECRFVGIVGIKAAAAATAPPQIVVVCFLS